MTDPVDDFLDRGFSAGSNDPLQAALRERTTRLLRRRRRLKRLASVGALAACFVAGMATMRWLTPPAPAIEPPAAPPVLAARKAEPAVNVEPMPRNAVVLEWQARVQPAERVHPTQRQHSPAHERHGLRQRPERERQ